LPILTADLAFLLQADSGAAPATPPIVAHGFSALAGLLSNIGAIAVCVLVLLLLASLYSWMVILSKWSSFRKATRDSRRFIRAFRKATRLQEIAAFTGD
jgi:biopolymer transport protein TolQ